jgi:hypothetical protein
VVAAIRALTSDACSGGNRTNRALPGVSPGIVETGIIMLTFGAMLFWIRINAGLLEWYYMEKEETRRTLRITVYEPQVPPTDEDSSGTMEFETSPRGSRTRVWGIIEDKRNEKWRLN